MVLTACLATTLLRSIMTPSLLLAIVLFIGRLNYGRVQLIDLFGFSSERALTITPWNLTSDKLASRRLTLTTTVTSQGSWIRCRFLYFDVVSFATSLFMSVMNTFFLVLDEMWIKCSMGKYYCEKVKNSFWKFLPSNFTKNKNNNSYKIFVCYSQNIIVCTFTKILNIINLNSWYKWINPKILLKILR